MILTFRPISEPEWDLTCKTHHLMMRITSTVTDGMMGNNGLSPFQTFCQHLLQPGSHPGQSAVKTITNKIDFADEEGKSKVSAYEFKFV